MVDISEVAECIYMIDNQIYSLTGWGSTYLINEDKKALIDPGSATCAGPVLEGINRLGVRPEDIDYLIVTHIHTDHAGGAGVIIQSMPKAQVLVHSRGAKHLVNPAKLMSSAIEARGEETFRKEGMMVPIEHDKVKSVAEGDTLRLSEKQLLRFINAPGHAPHELCIYESRNNGLFAGDAVGGYIADGAMLLLMTPPPSFDSKMLIDTLHRLIALKVSRLYFGHFGTTSEVQKNLKLAVQKIQVWDEMVNEAVREDNFDGVEEKIKAQLYSEIEPFKKQESLYRQLSDISVDLSVGGFMKYHRDKYEAEKRRDSEGNQRED